jgi:arylsulfatase A-like enzyme
MEHRSTNFTHTFYSIRLAGDPDERQWLPLYHNESIVQQPVQLATLADLYATQARNFIHQHARKGQPFFLYVPFSHVHQLCAPRELPEQTYCQWTADPTRLQFADAVQEMDWIVGKVMEALREAKIDSQTLVLFTADNGPWVAEQACSGKKGKFQGQWLMDHVDASCTACPHDYTPSPTKDSPHQCVLSTNPNMTLIGVPCGYDSGLGSVWESNLRMPAIARWTGMITPGGVTRQTVSTLDVLPTLLSLARLKDDYPERMTDWIIDGVDITSILFDDNTETRSNDKNNKRILFFWRDGFPDGPLHQPYGRMDVVAVKIGHLKAWFATKSGHYNADPHVWHDPPLVFDIEADPAEARPLNVSTSLIDFVKKLRHDHIVQTIRGDPLTLEQNDRYIPCANPDNQCRTDTIPVVKTIKA